MVFIFYWKKKKKKPWLISQREICFCWEALWAQETDEGGKRTRVTFVITPKHDVE